MNNFHAVGRIAAEIKLQKNENDNVDAADDNYYDDCSFSGYEYEDEGDIL